jgi:uncharacterized protein
MNSLRSKLILFAVLLLSLFPSLAPASTPEPPPVPREYVVDLARVIDPGVTARLNALLQELEQKTTAQVLVLTVQSLDGQGVEEFALNTLTKWKLGQKGKDNGVLLVVSVSDHKYRLEIGYGLEGVLPDSLVGTIGRTYLVPYFRKGDYSSGIYAAALAVIGTIAEHEGVSLATGQRSSGPREFVAQLPLSFAQKILFGVLFLAALILFITHPGQCFLIILASQIGGGRGGWSGGGGGFGGGGSFGGGGGGSGGGGGASGGW